MVNNYFGDPNDFKEGNQCHGDWESVIVYGKARVLDDPDELREAFASFMEYYGSVDYKPSEESLQRTKAIVIEAESMTARREDYKEVDYWSWGKS